MTGSLSDCLFYSIQKLIIRITYASISIEMDHYEPLLELIFFLQVKK